MMKNIISWASKGCNVTIAYYDADGYPFKDMIRSGQLSTQCQKLYRQEMSAYKEKLRIVKDSLDSASRSQAVNRDEMVGRIIDQHFDGYRSKNPGLSVPVLFGQLSDTKMVDSAVCERYFRQTVDADKVKFINGINDMLKPIPTDTYANEEASIQVNSLCTKLDAIKQSYLNKPYDQIKYSDIYNMYKDITREIRELFRQYGKIRMIPLNEHLTMSCWLTVVNGQDTAIIAFPSKYSTDEIGFISQDVAFAKYIQTMLNGMLMSHDVE
jgi:hypothetical protein